MSRYEGLREKADYVASMLTPRTAERKCFSGVNYQNLALGIEETSIKLVQAKVWRCVLANQRGKPTFPPLR
jgi:hypothetical protein